MTDDGAVIRKAGAGDPPDMPGYAVYDRGKGWVDEPEAGRGIVLGEHNPISELDAMALIMSVIGSGEPPSPQGSPSPPGAAPSPTGKP